MPKLEQENLLLRRVNLRPTYQVTHFEFSNFDFNFGFRDSKKSSRTPRILIWMTIDPKIHNAAQKICVNTNKWINICMSCALHLCCRCWWWIGIDETIVGGLGMTATMGLPQQQSCVVSQDTADYAVYLQSSHVSRNIINGNNNNNNHNSNSSNSINAKQATSENLRHQLMLQGGQKPDSRDHNTSFTSTKGLLNGPGQNNCFLNSAVQVSSLNSI